MTARAAAAAVLIASLATLGAPRLRAQLPPPPAAPAAPAAPGSTTTTTAPAPAATPGAPATSGGVGSASGNAPAGAPATGGAAPSENRASRRPESVDITLVGSAAAYDGLRARIGERMPSGAPLLWSRIDRFNPLAELLRGTPAARPTTLRCWIDLSDVARATLYFADQRGERFLVRELPLSGRFDEVDRQSLEQVMELSISALTENDAIGFTRAQARELFSRVPAPAVPPTAVAAAPPATPPPRGWELTTGVTYTLEEVGPALPVAQGPGLVFTLARADVDLDDRADRRDQPGAGLWVAGHYQLPAEARQADIGVRLQAITTRAGVDGHWWRLRARLGAGVDLIHVTPLAGAAAPAPMLAPAHWSRSFAISAAVAVRLPLEGALHDQLVVSLELFLDAIPSSTAYQFQDASGAHTAFAPRRLRPGLGIELAY